MSKFSIKKRQKLYQPLITITGLLVLIFILTSLVKNIRQVFSVKQEISQLQTEISRLEKKNQEIAGLVDYLDSKEFLEEEARLKFDLHRPNEQIIVIKQPELASQTSEATGSIFDLPEQPPNKVAISRNPNLWFNYFFAKR